MVTGLAIKGVPVDSAVLMAEGDFSDPVFAAAQSAFEAARGPGTPLLDAAPAEHEPPAPHLRAMLAELHAAAVAGTVVDLNTEDRARTYMELRLALVETLAARAARDAVPPDEAVPAEPASKRFLVSPRGEPSWLPEKVVRSIVRGRDAAALAAVVSPTSGAGLPPQRRLRVESEYWRGVPAHGAELGQLPVRRGEALRQAVDAGARLEPDPEEVADEPLAPAPAYGPASDVARALVERAGAPGTAAPPAGESLAAEIVKRFNLGAAPAVQPPSGDPAVLDGASARALIPTIDVMRNFYVKVL